MRNISIVDETFDINITQSYHLSVQISYDGVCFAVLDPLRKKYIAFKNLLLDKNHPSTFEDQIKRLFQNDNYLNQKYKSSAIIFATANTTLVPNPLFDKDKLEQLYHFSNLNTEQQKICSNEISCIDARIIYSIPLEIIKLVKENQNNFQIFHQSCPIIENSYIVEKGKRSETLVTVQIFPDFFDLTIFKNGKFELYNTFTYKSDQDLIFYILFVYEQFGLNPEEVGLSLCGHVEKESELISLMSQFIKQIKFEKFARYFTYSYTFEQLKEHQFINLINLYRCV